jgi:hypothetical protein
MDKIRERKNDKVERIWACEICITKQWFL